MIQNTRQTLSLQKINTEHSFYFFLRLFFPHHIVQMLQLLSDHDYNNNELYL